MFEGFTCTYATRRTSQPQIARRGSDTLRRTSLLGLDESDVHGNGTKVLHVCTHRAGGKRNDGEAQADVHDEP